MELISDKYVYLLFSYFWDPGDHHDEADVDPVHFKWKSLINVLMGCRNVPLIYIYINEK